VLQEQDRLKKMRDELEQREEHLKVRAPAIDA
jgi:hypothetical protein